MEDNSFNTPPKFLQFTKIPSPLKIGCFGRKLGIPEETGLLWFAFEFLGEVIQHYD